MKISKKAIVTLCIIVPILAIVLWYYQKPNFSKYHSYAVVFHDEDLETYIDIPLTDEQFQKIAQGYINEKTLHQDTIFERVWMAGYKIKLYKTKDMSGEYDVMWTGGLGDNADACLWINDKCFNFNTSRPINNADKIIFELIKQYESEREL
ncbi:MAG: hypothetical protein NC253_08515 [Ruminococcus sp.]|nr:hypothetical protein [Ruminococcus sp.]MCM1382201.1 hypothetical protein [Muribaculaceae bacterium]MCM1478956.1 hypothetical protein [Muribaculaceae bacterium]